MRRYTNDELRSMSLEESETLIKTAKEENKQLGEQIKKLQEETQISPDVDK